MKFATLCSGIEAVSQGWEPLGFKAQFFSEIESFPNALLTHYWPTVPNLGDMTKLDAAPWRHTLDILWGSFPCQAWSLGGMRKGGADPRGALTLKGVELIDIIDPPIFCFENVKGILSDQKNGFGQFLGRLAGEDEALVAPGGKWTHAGYVAGPKRRIAWRLLDAQHFGVAQSRERVYLIACTLDGPDPRDILFEQIVSNLGGDQPAHANHRPKGADVRAYPASYRTRSPGGPRWELGEGELSHCLRASQGGSDKGFVFAYTPHRWRLRRLMPIEAERLMGMKDDFTLIPHGKKIASDAVRYKAIGNSVVVPVVRWLGERIIAASE